MKILLIDVNCKQSSTGKIVYALYEQLKQAGHTAAVCYGRGAEIKEEGIYKFGLDWETCLHAGMARLTGKNGYYSPFSTRRLIAYIEEFKPDLIHLHELHAYFVNIYPLLAYIKRWKIPVVWTFHCEYMYTGKCGNAQTCTKWLSGCGHCPAVKKYPKSLFWDRSKTMFLDKQQALKDWPFTIVTPSKWLAGRVAKSFLNRHTCEVIPNGIDTQEVFYPRPEKPEWAARLHPGKKIILSVAPAIMSEEKGGKIILELSRRVQDKPYEFVLIGADKTKRYADNVFLIARTKSQTELARWYSLADVFLIGSKTETFGLTVAEALACGTPVVGFESGAPAEIAPAPYGYFVPWGDLKGLEELILRVISNVPSRAAVRDYACRQYEESVMARRYMGLYQQMLTSQNQAALG